MVEACTQSPEIKPELRGRRVLIVDDDRIMLKAIEMRCRGIGLRVESTSDGHQLLARTPDEAPDLLIVDQTLSDIDGFKLVEMVRTRGFPTIPVIIFTGRTDARSIERCKELGVHYLHKGIASWDQLQALLYELLGNTGHNEIGSPQR